MGRVAMRVATWLPSNDSAYQALASRLTHLDTDEDLLTELGQILFHALFQGTIKEVYTRSQGVLANDQGLRLTLNIATTEAAIAALPWEYLYDPDRGPLALLDTPIVRYLPHQARIPTLKVELPLKILLTAAHTPPRVDVEQELRIVEAALADLGEFVQITVEPHLTAEKFQELVRDGDFQIWHFVGHGWLGPESTTGHLAFEHATRDVDHISAPQLSVLLNRGSLRLVVLDACQSARLAVDPLRAIAPALIRAQIPAVVAMQFSLPEETMRAFAQEFYRALAVGLPIDACVTEGRKGVMNASSLARPDWGIPTVYTRAPDGMLFDLPPLPKPRCPYPGMVPFRAEDADRFYGRAAEIKQMLQHLRHHQLLFVVGPSGSGKSSLVGAGLLPKLLENTKDFWLVRSLRPGTQPLAALSQAIEGDPEQISQAIADLLARYDPARRLLLVVDQFEELFTQTEREEQRRFIAALNVLRQDEHCALVISMRADFYPDLMISNLWPIDPSQRLEIAPLHGTALREAIVQPAKNVGVRLEPGLVERLLADAADEPGVLPLIQETMVMLWDQMTYRVLSLSAYTRLGREGRSGLAVALATKADATLAGFKPVQHTIARRIFLRLIQFGEGRADTRRRQTVAALCTAQDDPLLFEQTLRHLANNRLLTLRGEEGNPDRQVDIAHEALINGWPALRAWVKEQREAEQIRRRLEVKVEEWVRMGRGMGGLLDTAELVEVEPWLATPSAHTLGLSEDLLAFVKASRVAFNPGWHRWGVLGMAAIGLSLAGLLGLLYIQIVDLPLVLRIMIWSFVGVLGVLALIASGFLRKGERYAGQRMSQKIARGRAAYINIASLSCGTVVLWLVFGAQAVQMEVYCSRQGYARATGNTITIAIDKRWVDFFDLYLLSDVLSSYPQIRSQVVEPEDAEYCKRFFSYRLELYRFELPERNEISYRVNLLQTPSGNVPQLPPEVRDTTEALTNCGLFAQIAYTVVKAIGENPQVIIQEGPKPPPVKRCEAFLLNNDGFKDAMDRKFDDARMKLTKAIEIEPEYAVAHANLGFVYLETEQYDVAIKEFQTAITILPNFAPFVNQLARAYYQQGKYDLAEQQYQQAIMIDPGYMRAYVNLAVVYREQGHYERAEALLQQAKDLLPSFAVGQEREWHEAHLQKNWAILEFLRENFPLAIEKLEYVDGFSGAFEEEIVYYLALSYEQLGNADRACENWLRYDEAPSGLFKERERRHKAIRYRQALNCAPDIPAPIF